MEKTKYENIELHKNFKFVKSFLDSLQENVINNLNNL